MFNKTDEQAAIETAIKTTKANLIVQAYAGCGKTTTAIKIAAPAMSQMGGRIVFLSFNKAIVAECKARISEEKILSCEALTFHSLGLRSLSRALKLASGIDFTNAKWEKTVEDLEIAKHFYSFAKKLVSLAKNHGFGVLVNTLSTDNWMNLVEKYDLEQDLIRVIKENSQLNMDDLDSFIAEGIQIAKKALQHAEKLAVEKGIIDFDDMVWLPLKLNLKLTKYEWVIVDELQDSNPVRMALVRAILSPYGGRVLGIGDKHQAIYGFSGADTQSMENFKTMFSCKELTLSFTYRCGKAIVADAQEIVPGIRAAETNHTGTVERITTFERDLDWTTLDPAGVIINRTTAPIVALAYKLIAKGVACKVEGRKIGEGLIALIQKLCGKKITDLLAFEERLQDYRESEEQKLLAKGKELQAEALADKVETIQVVIQNLKTYSLEALLDTLRNLFNDDPNTDRLTLCTAHRSKGREWSTVYVLEGYYPSPYARQQWQQEQEQNLIYVARTRAINKLVKISNKLELKASKKITVEKVG